MIRRLQCHLSNNGTIVHNEACDVRSTMSQRCSVREFIFIPANRRSIETINFIISKTNCKTHRYDLDIETLEILNIFVLTKCEIQRLSLQCSNFIWNLFEMVYFDWNDFFFVFSHRLIFSIRVFGNAKEDLSSINNKMTLGSKNIRNFVFRTKTMQIYRRITISSNDCSSYHALIKSRSL